MSPKKVLIADDEKTVQMAGKMFFEQNGYETITVDNGEAALDEISKAKPDFVFLDVVMPGKDGFEVCREIKSNEDNKNMVVIIFSGNVPEIEKGFDYGADDCILKPLNWDDLVVKMEALAKEKWENTGQ